MDEYAVIIRRGGIGMVRERAYTPEQAAAAFTRAIQQLEARGFGGAFMTTAGIVHLWKRVGLRRVHVQVYLERQRMPFSLN